LRERRARRVEIAAPVSGSPVLAIFLWSRAAIWAAALFALFTFQPNRNPRASIWDDPTLTHDLGAAVDVWARWDSVWFLRIADHGYSSASHADAAFYPLYPAAIAGLGRALFGHYLLAGLLISLAASLGAFWLLHRAAEERLGAEGARRAVLYLAVFPMSLFLVAVYSASLCLLLSLAAFLLAERGRWLGAWSAAALALLTRFAGAALVPALVLLAWRSPARGRRGDRPCGCVRALPALPRPAHRRRLVVRPLAGALAPAPLLRRAARRNLGRAAQRLGRSRAARERLAHPPLLDGGRGHRSDAGGGDQPRGARLPRPLRLAGDDRLAPLRRSLRPVLVRQPGHPSQRSQRQVAVALHAALRARRLPALPGARSRRRQAAPTRR